MGYSDKLSNTG